MGTSKNSFFRESVFDWSFFSSMREELGSGLGNKIFFFPDTREELGSGLGNKIFLFS